MCKPPKDLMCDIVVKVKPCRSNFPMSMVSLESVNPCDLCIVNPHDILSGICFLLPCFMGGIGIYWGLTSSHGGPIYVSNSTTTYVGKLGGLTPFV